MTLGLFVWFVWFSFLLMCIGDELTQILKELRRKDRTR